MLAEDKPDEETHIDRKKKYKELVAGGMSDKAATEKVWPSMTSTIVKNAKEKADKEAKEASESKA
jgi:hypothetical protein